MKNNNSRHYQKTKKSNKYISLITAGIQIGVTIWLGNQLGIWVDKKYNTTNFETIITLTSIIIAISLLIVQVIRISKEDD